MATARCSFSSLLLVRMVFAPFILAICSPKMLTPPVPSSSTVSCGPMFPVLTSACHAVTPAQGKVAASSKLKL